MKRFRLFIPLVIIIVIAVMMLVSSLTPDKVSDANEDQNIKSRDTAQSLPKLNKPELLHGNSFGGKHSVNANAPEAIFPDGDQKPADKLTEEDLLSWNLIHVGRDNPIDRSFTVDLVESNNGLFIDVRIHTYLEAMIRDAADDDVIIEVCSAYRSVSTQKSLIERRAQSMMTSGLDIDIAYHKAEEYLASPGESEHHTGLAVDFITPGKSTLDESFAETEAFAWLSENAFRYGFILRYPKDKEDISGFPYEPWHFRYVGNEHAASMNSSGMCLEEYISVAIE